MIENARSRPRARERRSRASRPSRCFAPDSVTGFAATPSAIEAELAKRRQARGQASRRRRRQALALARACRHQMRGLELSATRHRHHGGARRSRITAKPCSISFPAVPSPSCRSKATAPPSCGRRTRRRARRSWRPTRRVPRRACQALRHEARRHRACRSAPILPARLSDRAQLRGRAAWRWSAMLPTPSIRLPARVSISGCATWRRSTEIIVEGARLGLDIGAAASARAL